MKNEELIIQGIPKNMQLCFLEQCPLRETCIRHVAGKALAKRLDWGPAIYPSALSEDGKCKYYIKTEPQRMAYGFSKLFYNVLHRHDYGLRHHLMNYLGGHGPYYRYNSGEKLLTEEQQKYILDYFRSCGYSEGLEFDHYVEAYSYK